MKKLATLLLCCLIFLLSVMDNAAQNSDPNEKLRKLEDLIRKEAQIDAELNEQIELAEKRINAKQEALSRIKGENKITEDKVAELNSETKNTSSNKEESVKAEMSETISNNTSPKTDSKNIVKLNEKVEGLKKQYCETEIESKDANGKSVKKYVSVDDKNTCELALAYITDKTGNGFTPQQLQQDNLLVPAIVSKTAETLLLESERLRTQFGADVKSSGTTSLTERAGIPQTVSFAAERGATVSTTEGTSLTVRFNPIGIINAARCPYGQNTFVGTKDDACRIVPKSKLVKFFKSTSFGFIFDTSGIEAKNGFSFKRDNVSQVSFRYEYGFQRYKRRPFTYYLDQEDEKINEKFPTIDYNDLFFTAKNNSNTSIKEGEFRYSFLQNWFVDLQNDLQIARRKYTSTGEISAQNMETAVIEFKQIIKRHLANLPVSELKKNPELLNMFADIVRSYVLSEWDNDPEEKAKFENLYTKLKRDNGSLILGALDPDEYVRDLSKGHFFAFDYVNNRVPNVPDTSNIRFIYEGGAVANLFNVTANGSLNFFHKDFREPTPGFKRLRDFGVSLQIGVPLGKKILGIDNTFISLSGKYQRMNSNSRDLFGKFLDVKGDIVAAQFKVNIPLGNAGLQIPLAFTYANRPELFKEVEKRGNFGLTFDFTSLLTYLLPELFR